MSGDFDALMETVLAQKKRQGLLLLLDYDGTLVEIAPWPHLACPALEVLESLTRLTVLPDLEAVVISGRSLRNLQELLPVPGLQFVGSHGGEGLIKGSLWTSRAGRVNDEERDRLHHDLLDCLCDCKAWWVESKPFGLAIHYRQATPKEAAKILATLKPLLNRVTEGERLEVLRERAVVEILPGGVSKGEAIMELILSAEFSHLLPIYFGDDVADASAFKILKGRGLTVRVGPSAAGADYFLVNPVEVRRFLEVLATRWSNQT
jgi:trehalose 6-phosphate phosphatase